MNSDPRVGGELVGDDARIQEQMDATATAARPGDSDGVARDRFLSAAGDAHLILWELRAWFQADGGPSASSMYSDDFTWKQMVDRYFDLVLGVKRSGDGGPAVPVPSPLQACREVVRDFLHSKGDVTGETIAMCENVLAVYDAKGAR